MSSPTKISASPVGAREGTRVILREITASLHNSPPLKAQNKSGNDTLTKVNAEHEVKVKFAREFADAETYLPGRFTTENSLSPASSFLSVTSTLSTKSSSGICVDSPARSNDSYSNLEIPGLDDLVSACAKIHLDETHLTTSGGDNSFADATFRSATEEIQLDQDCDLFRSREASPSINDVNQASENDCNTTYVASNPPSPGLNRTWEIDNLQKSTLSDNDPQNIILNTSPAYETANETFLQHKLNNESLQIPIKVFQPLDSSKTVTSVSSVVNESSSGAEEPPVTDFGNLTKTDGEFKVPFPAKDSKTQANLHDHTINVELLNQINRPIHTILEVSNESISSINVPSFIENQSLVEKLDQTTIVSESVSQVINSSSEEHKVCENLLEKENSEACLPDISIVQQAPKDIDNEINLPVNVEPKLAVPIEQSKLVNENKEEIEVINIDLDSTIIVDSNTDFFSDLESNQKESDQPKEVEKVEKIEPTSSALHTENLNLPQDYGEFTPQRQSTSLNCIALKQNLEVGKSLQDREASELEFFDARNTTLDIPKEFEKLTNESQNIANDTIDNTSIELVDEPDQFTSASNDLFRDPSNFEFLLSKTDKNYSERLRDSLYLKFDPLASRPSMLPQGNGATPPSNDEQNGEKDISVPNIGTPKRNPAVAAIDRLLFYSPMSTDIQKNVESEKIESAEKENYQKEIEDLRESVNQLQSQLAKEIKHKNQINVVVDEYEKSISRLVAEREKDKKNQDVEKAALLEELSEVKNHLSASEAAFNDVHAKYERLKIVCTTLKNNEIALKESIAENVSIIKSLENRYEQVKIHAAARLDKANEELDSMCKQHESEVVKLRAMLRKEELKSNSLSEMIEQKVKENKELTKILDEVLGRVNLADK